MRPTPNAPLRWALLFASCCVASATFAYRRGQDVNSDQLNYHFYAAYAFLHGRIDIDSAPAQIIHSFFNPLGYVPFYLLFRLAGPVTTSLVLAAIQACNLAAVAWIARSVCRDLTERQRLAAIGAALAISAASPMALSELGTSFIDTLTALPVLAAICLLPGVRTPLTRLLACGVLVGGATGLKLTNAVFAIGLLGACLVEGPGLVARVRAVAATCLGLGTGFIALSGWWCLMLFRRFGNPVFPYYNDIFRSPDFPFTSDIDHRYLPASLWDAFAAPFRWAVGIVPIPEIGFTDIRFAVIAGLLGLGAVIAIRRWPATRFRGGLPLLVFCVVSFVVWLKIFAIQRYLVTLELLCGPLALLALGWIVNGWTRAGAGWVLALAAWTTVVVPDWRHTPFLPGQYRLVVPAPLADDGLFLVAGEPISYVIPLLSKQARFFGIMEWEDTAATADTVFTRRIAKAVRDADGRPIRVLANQPMSWQTRLRIGSYGLRPTGACQDIPGYSSRGTNTACVLARTADTGPALMPLPTRELPFGVSGVDYLVLAGEPSTDWQVPGPIGDIRDDHRPSLIFRRPDLPGVTHLAIDVRYELIGATFGPDTLSLDANETEVARTGLSRDPVSNDWSYTGCVAYDPSRGEAVEIGFRSRGRMIVKLLAFAASPAASCP